MNPDIVPLLAKVIVPGIVSWYAKDSNPPRLSGNMLALFQKFKNCYDSKDARELSRTISDSYCGSFYKAKTKYDLLKFFELNFNALPWFIYPSLTINIYHIVEENDRVFRAVLDFKSYLKAAFLIPLGAYEPGQVHVEARPDGAFGIWRITSIDTIGD
jgi:hypothetical protein